MVPESLEFLALAARLARDDRVLPVDQYFLEGALVLLGPACAEFLLRAGENLEHCARLRYDGQVADELLRAAKLLQSIGAAYVGDHLATEIAKEFEKYK